MDNISFLPKVKTIRYGENCSKIYVENNHGLNKHDFLSNGNFTIRVVGTTKDSLLLELITTSAHDYITHEELTTSNWKVK